MRFTRTTFTLLALSTLAILSQAALTKEEEAAAIAKDGPNANLCAPCLEKAMNNHFPHACSKDIDYEAANSRPSGATPTEERCVCVSFNDLYWMKADCSKECLYVHNPQAMAHFLPASQIEGCGNWIDFETGQEKEVEGYPAKDPNHKPEVFELHVPSPEDMAAFDSDGRTYDVKTSVTFADDKKESKEAAENPEKEEEAKVDTKAPSKENPKEEL
ncbi:hypothetical protein DFQ27_005121 [Actinomortierella ambigua]|uniref:Uncharacterized protein n=1 Tax=Actinomortierella ambigua TaxID=1343610 RepID=A0A9P6UCG1_9FUNG|nr:hypothetical protein DFQ26_004593 [Actinomortierella ambigua]KAG0269015.1 hypothetical protein DFQ27_005121 [Actinomortierella ambigua]